MWKLALYRMMMVPVVIVNAFLIGMISGAVLMHDHYKNNERDDY